MSSNCYSSSYWKKIKSKLAKTAVENKLCTSRGPSQAADVSCKFPTRQSTYRLTLVDTQVDTFKDVDILDIVDAEYKRR